MEVLEMMHVKMEKEASTESSPKMQGIDSLLEL
jgi:hypothetical protein